MDDPGLTLEALSREECWARLASSTVGRVAVTSRALPAVVPVNFALLGNNIVFRTTRDGMLARACDQSVVAFEVDDLAPDGRSGWSVLVVGISRLMEGSEALRATELRLVSAAGGSRDQFVAIPVSELSGRRLATTGSDHDLARGDRASAAGALNVPAD